MSANAGPNLIENDLIMYLDPANKQCFVPGNTFCTNLITGNQVTGANGAPGSGTHTANPSYFPLHSADFGGVFDFSGGKGMNFDEDLGFRSETTLCMWFYKTSSNAEYFSDARNNGGQWFLSNYSNDNINYTEALTYNFDGSYNASNVNFLNKWHFMCVTSNSTESKLYLNGVLVSGGTRNSIDEDFGVNFRIGTRYTTTAPWTGYMGNIFAYSRVLTEQEVKQNFNALRGRYGI